MQLSGLASKLYDAKKVEEAARTARIAIEEQIAEVVETGENESKTVKACDGLKITVKRALNYKADVDAIRALAIDDTPLKLVPSKYELDTKAYELLKTKDPQRFKMVSQHVVTKPAKVSVTLKLG